MKNNIIVILFLFSFSSYNAQTFTWSTVGSGMGNFVNVIAISGNDVYAGGTFTTAGGTSASRIAKWNGTSWSALGTGVNSDVYAIAVSGSDVYAGGNFTNSGRVRIAKWDGSTWSAVGSGTGANGAVRAIAVSGTDIYIGGDFTTVDGVTVNRIAKWNGSNWSALNNGVGASVRTIAIYGGNIVIGGSFTDVDGNASIDYLASWNGSSWSALGIGVNHIVYTTFSNGTDLYAGGSFSTAGGSSALRIAKWNGTVWSSLGTGLGNTVNTIFTFGSDVYCGGLFTTAGGSSANYAAKYNGTTWSTIGNGLNAQVNAMYVSTYEGKMYVGGNFTTSNDGGTTFNYIGKFSDSGNPLPVELTAFSGIKNNEFVELNWTTNTEINNYGFSIERYKDIGWKAIGFVKGNGNSNSEKKYSFTDKDILNGKIQYRLKQIDFSGNYKYSEIIEIVFSLPSVIKLEQNFPNPYNPSTNISYQLTESSFVSLKIYDLLGNEVVSLVNETKEAGFHNFLFNSSKYSLSSGIYFYRLVTQNKSVAKKMILSK